MFEQVTQLIKKYHSGLYVLGTATGSYGIFIPYLLQYISPTPFSILNRFCVMLTCVMVRIYKK